MFFFLCEGEEGKSEYKFFKSIINEFHTDEDYVLDAAGGNINLLSHFKALSERFADRDTFILFFDNVETIGGEFVTRILSNMRKKCDSLGVAFRYTTYW